MIDLTPNALSHIRRAVLELKQLEVRLMYEIQTPNGPHNSIINQYHNPRNEWQLQYTEEPRLKATFLIHTTLGSSDISPSDYTCTVVQKEHQDCAGFFDQCARTIESLEERTGQRYSVKVEYDTPPIELSVHERVPPASTEPNVD